VIGLADARARSWAFDAPRGRTRAISSDDTSPATAFRSER
jgi:hypothetical protein